MLSVLSTTLRASRAACSRSNAASSAASKGSYFVQVSSSPSKAEAESSWKRISEKFSVEVKGSNKNIVEAEVKGKTYYRLSFGPFADKDAASTKCGVLKTKGQDCIVQKL